MDQFSNGKGGILPIFLITLAIVGIIVFLLFVYLLPSSRNKFASFFVKPPSQAQTATASATPTGSVTTAEWTNGAEILNDWNISDPRCLNTTSGFITLSCNTMITSKKIWDKDSNIIISGSFRAESETDEAQISIALIDASTNSQDGTIRFEGFKNSQSNSISVLNNEGTPNTVLTNQSGEHTFRLVYAQVKEGLSLFYYLDDAKDPFYKVNYPQKSDPINPIQNNPTVHLGCQAGSASKILKPLCSFGPLTVSSSE